MAENPNGKTRKSRAKSRKPDEKRAIEETVIAQGSPGEEERVSNGVESVDVAGAEGAATIPQVEGTPSERPSLKQTILEQLMGDPTFRRRVVSRLIKKLR